MNNQIKSAALRSLGIIGLLMAGVCLTYGGGAILLSVIMAFVGLRLIDKARCYWPKK